MKKKREKGETWFSDGQVCSLPLVGVFDVVPQLAGAAPVVCTRLHPQPAVSLPQHVAPEVPVCLHPDTYTHMKQRLLTQFLFLNTNEQIKFSKLKLTSWTLF